MPKEKKLTQNEKDLTRRYLVWCYKTTRELLDKTDRYFTQSEVDKQILKSLNRSKIRSPQYEKLVKEFDRYAHVKLSNAEKQKYANKAQYMYTRNRFAAIEEAIKRTLGKKELDQIREMYEKEMTQRILQARDHT